MPWLPNITIVDVLDIATVAILILIAISSWRRIRVRAIARVLLAAGIVFLAAHTLGLRMTIQILNVSAVIVALVLAIAYHVEIKRAMERSVMALTRRIVAARSGATAAVDSGALPGWAETLAHSIREMALAKTGALIVLRGEDAVDDHLTGGTPLDAILSEALLLSVFDPNSAGHDGAMVIEAGRAVGFQHHLPLSEDHGQLTRRGTRHAAALGLAERCDAMCIVVSEERGSVSVARHGTLRTLPDPTDLQSELEAFIRGRDTTMPTSSSVGTWWWLRRALVAVPLSLVLWYLLVHESQTEYRSYAVSIGFTGLDPGLAVANVEPPEVKVILMGPRRAFHFVRKDAVGMVVPLFDLTPGQHEFTLTASEVDRPAGLEFANMFPRQVRITIE